MLGQVCDSEASNPDPIYDKNFKLCDFFKPLTGITVNSFRSYEKHWIEWIATIAANIIAL